MNRGTYIGGGLKQKQKMHFTTSYSSADQNKYCID